MRTVEVGDPIDCVSWRPTPVGLFRFSATTWNPHRIHFDQAYARSEGYDDVLVQSHFHGCMLAHSILAWAGPGAFLRRFRWENRGMATPGDVLTVSGTVVDVQGSLVSCELEEINQEGQLCAPGWATVQLA